MPATPAPPTAKQVEVFRFIAACQIERGVGPTIREIGRAFGIVGPNGVMCHVRALVLKGLVEFRPGVARGILVAGLADAVSSAAEAHVAAVVAAARS